MMMMITNNKAAAGANIQGLIMGQILYLALHTLSYLTLKQTHIHCCDHFTDAQRVYMAGVISPGSIHQKGL